VCVCVCVCVYVHVCVCACVCVYVVTAYNLLCFAFAGSCWLKAFPKFSHESRSINFLHFMYPHDSSIGGVSTVEVRPVPHASCADTDTLKQVVLMDVYFVLRNCVIAIK
jgi:hypothetical protein